jgi:small nuclear ribonucleoprotein (snRNP)-like protein
MSIVQDVLRDLLGKEVVIICTDSQAYRGRLEKFDEDALSLKEVLELRKEDLKWVDPTVSPKADGADIGGQLDAYGSVDLDKIRVSLRHVFIRVDTISRIWPWATEEDSKAAPEFELI